MAADDLNSFTTQYVVGGFLLFCLLSFAISFMYYNNPTGINDGTESILQNTYDSSNSVLTETTTDANSLLNITSNTNPEVSDLGSRDSVATSYGAFSVAKSNFESGRALISWVFTGTSGKILLGVLSGLIGLLAFFYITKFIRQGS